MFLTHSRYGRQSLWPKTAVTTVYGNRYGIKKCKTIESEIGYLERNTYEPKALFRECWDLETGCRDPKWMEMGYRWFKKGYRGPKRGAGGSRRGAGGRDMWLGV